MCEHHKNIETVIFLLSPFVALIVFAAGANWIIKKIDNKFKEQ